MSKVLFVAPRRSPEASDNYWIRQAILRALTRPLTSLHGVDSGIKPYRSFILENSTVTRYLGLDFPAAKYADQALPDLAWDGQSIPLVESSVDCVMATEVLDHCPKPKAVLGEIQRVLKPGGPFFCTVPFLWPLHDNRYDEYRFTPFTLQRLLKEAGFSVQVEKFALSLSPKIFKRFVIDTWEDIYVSTKSS